MTLSAPIYALKHEARLMGRRDKLPLHAALNAIARREGFRSWSHLSAAAPTPDALNALMRVTGNGGLILLAARPGQGKTLLALQMLAKSAQAGRDAILFTLDYSQPQIDDRLAHLNIPQPAPFDVDLSNQISGAYIRDALAARAGPSLAAVDYLQLLDQRRSTPPLHTQIADLADYTRRSGDTIVLISQIDRQFDETDRPLPGLGDLRLPNPVALSDFAAAVFVHAGRFAAVDPRRAG